MKTINSFFNALSCLFAFSCTQATPLRIVKSFNPGKEYLACAMDKHRYGIVNPLYTHEFVQYQKAYILTTAKLLSMTHPHTPKINFPMDIINQKKLVLQ